MIRMMRTILAIVVASATFFPAIKEVAAAEPKSLAEVEEFAFGGVGVAGIESQGERFFRAVMDSNDALATFQKILGRGTAAAKLYALCGIRLLSERHGQPPIVSLSDEYKLVDALEQLVREGVPSLSACRSLKITGPWVFASDVVIQGDVEFRNDTSDRKTIAIGQYENQTVG